MSKRDVILSLVFGAILIFSILNYNKVNQLERELDLVYNLQHEVQSVNQSVQDISAQMDAKLDEFLQEQLWVYEKGYTVSEVDIQEDKIDVNMAWSIRDLHEQEEVSVLYREEGDSEWTEVEATNLNGLNYTLEHTFPLSGNYETQVVATSASGKRSENLLNLNFKELIDTRMKTGAFVHEIGPGRYDVNIDVYNPLEHELMSSENKENLRIKSAKAFLYVNGELMTEIDLLKQDQAIQSDPYGESIFYQEMIELEGEVDQGGEIELRVVVEDGLGMKYEINGESM